jgi:hypothetical protein
MARQMMTLAQRKKLDTIIGKLEALQQEVEDPTRDLEAAKTRLLRVLRDAGGV